MTLGPRLADDYTGTLRYALGLDLLDGIGVECGVATGGTLRMIAARMPAVGFDSFDGLPEDWRPGFGAGMFACPVPNVPGAELVVGLFGDTLPAYRFDRTVALLHIDCDLYASTVTVLEHVPLVPGCVVVFDEFHGYPGHEQHEALAWAEHVERTGIAYTVLGHGPEQLAVRIG